jgi:shikimate dehydrogenase
MPKLAVLGQPISHSRSPAMHNAALAALGLAGTWTYQAIEVAPDHFAARVRAMPREGFVGANVTIPHKLAALALADEASEAARAIGAPNTLSFAGGRVVTENTDAIGFLEALPNSPEAKRALVLGAGGSSRAVVWALLDRGAEVAVWNRTPARAEALVRQLGGRVAKPSRVVDAVSMRDYDLIVNATTVGMGASSSDPADLKSLPIDADGLGEKHQLVDLAYGAVETELVRAAKARGVRVVDGLEVLVRQGAASLRIWTGLDPPIEAMRSAARANEWQSKKDPRT